MPSFTILEVAPESRAWQTKTGNPWLSYAVQFKGDQGEGNGELSRPATSPAPTVGEVIEATLENDNPRFPAKLREARKGAPNGFRGGAGKSPTERAEIRRMASQKVAVELLALEVAAGLQFNETVTAGGALKTRIDWLDKDVREAGERA